MPFTVHDPARRMLSWEPACLARHACIRHRLSYLDPALPPAAQRRPGCPAGAEHTRHAPASVNGTLLPAGYHYLGLEPTFRDGTVVLTIALEPADDEDLRGAINFLVLTDDGLRRVLAGADPFDLDIAASAPLQFDPIGNKYQAVFKASGKGPYTVIVYNTRRQDRRLYAYRAQRRAAGRRRAR